MDKNYKDYLKELVQESSLTENQKMLWSLFLKVSHSEEDEAVYEAASDSLENLGLLTEHLRDKIWDMKQNDEDKWRKLIDDEEKYANIL